MKPTIDPPDIILDEIHDARRRLLEQHGGVSGLAAFLREQEAKTDRKLRPPEPLLGPNQAMRRGRKRRAADE